ncbi:SAM-dependent methyltransferase [Candidatus Trichorickettsia mobilis]|uniref:Polyamine aminopropyltransferase n=1 Tax=Candidatus Trichorickettsia mobilis TaxID=1346319 RepID=A0ABZ0UQY5_9RICK|nr:fused MFS/spermidine synthase [Candidatus Trichorickettsia mobilis]WPY00450.1 SAM-dependent methyltransferase [Candidatus Trichorickettsia mobilis]
MNTKITNRHYIYAVILLSICCYLSAIAQATQTVILHHSSNKYGPIWVYDSADLKRCLSFVPPGQVIQSCMMTSEPDKLIFDYAKMVLGTLYLNKNPKKILMIGLGGGSVAKALYTILPSVKLDIVEINPDIPALAKKYFAFQEDDHTRIFVEDGFDFIKNSHHNSYDIVIIDAFTKDYVPPSFLTLEFVKNVQNVLKPNGVVAVNTFKNNSYYELESKLYKEIFGDFFNLISLETRVIIAKKGELPSFAKIQKQAINWKFSFTRLDIDEEWLLDKFIKQK